MGLWKSPSPHDNRRFWFLTDGTRSMSMNPSLEKCAWLPCGDKTDGDVWPWERCRDRTPTPVRLERALGATVSERIWDLSWLSVRGLMFKAHPTTFTYREAQKWIYYPQEGRIGFCWFCSLAFRQGEKGAVKTKEKKQRGQQKRDKMSILFSLINLGRCWQCRMRNGK